MDTKEIKELRDFGIQILTVGCLNSKQTKRLAELIGNACERIKELEDGYKKIQTLNAGKDNDIDWLCEQAQKRK